MNDRRTLIRRYFELFRAGDRAGIEALLSADFTYTSPHERALDRAAYFERCWPQASSVARHELSLILVDGDDALAHYDAALTDGQNQRNVERFRFAGDRIRSVEVFAGLARGSEAVSPEAAIRTVLSQREDALSVKDARLVAAKHDPDCLVFALAPPLASRGETEASLEAWFKSWTGPITWETREPEIHASGDVAYVSALEHMVGERADGHHADLWFRVTLGLVKRDGAWKIAHEHQSVPFYMDGTNDAAIDLKPELAGAAVSDRVRTQPRHADS